MLPNHQPINHKNYLQLLELREALTAFQTASCKLVHEKVQRFIEDSNADNPEQLRAIRNGLCDVAVRRYRLGCAHSMSNVTFQRLVERLYNTGILQTGAHPSEEIKEVVMKIYEIDHEKGSIEKRKALALRQQHSEQMPLIEDAIKDITVRHQAAIAQLEQIRSNIMHQLDAAIERYQSVIQPT